jgi:hypothetical protein
MGAAITRIGQDGPWHLLRPTGGCYCGKRPGDLICETGHGLKPTCRRCLHAVEVEAAKVRALAASKAKEARA